MLKKSSALMIAVALAAAPIALASVPASAATAPKLNAAVTGPYSEDENEDGVAFSAQKEDHEGEDEDSDHEDSDHEDSDHEDHHGVIPPVVIKHHDDDDDDDDDDHGKGGSNFVPAPGVTPAPGASPAPLGSGASLRGGRYEVAPIDPSVQAPGAPGQASNHGSQIDPNKVPAVDVSGINPNAKTPADVFMEAATLGLTAMGVGAIALGGVAGVRAIRLRKNPLGDYFYEADKKD